MAGIEIVIASSVVGASCGVGVALSVAKKSLREGVAKARSEAKAALKGASLEASALQKSMENDARSQALVSAERGDEDQDRERETLNAQEEVLQERSEVYAERREALDDRKEDIRDRESAVKGQRDRAKSFWENTDSVREELVTRLEELGATTSDEVVSLMRSRWVEEARREAAQHIRNIEQNAGSSEHGREANRLMDVAVSRYQNHFLTVRSVSNIHLERGVRSLLLDNDSHILNVLAEEANTKLNMHESEDSLRLEGLDGVGREVARRALKALGKKPKSLALAKEDPVAWVQQIRERLDGEIERLGKKAFKVLKVEIADPEIVTLVGQLNYRTSYTQNQWLHAVEAAFLAGMMAEELGLDIALARRATLMHDIGKALTHKIEGSHAVIGADIARRVGEDEIVANAIGSHHADEPANSAYAYLVAAADAMSGARPGARREQTEGFSTRLDDLERLGGRYKGVDYCAAVHGGRELRVYVHDKEIGDLAAVEMSSDIAAQISDELTFPGQVKVTVIRSSESVAVAY